MKSTPVILFLILSIITASCCGNPKKSTETQKASIINPVDTILGNRLMENGKIRPTNFDQILKISAENLSRNSDNWKIVKIDSNCYLFNQKNNSVSVRPTAIIVKTAGNRIIQYKAIEDYNVHKILSKNGDIYALCDDFIEGRNMWKAKYDIALYKLDSDLNEIWKYKTISREFPFEANDLQFRQDALVAKINVITGCSICYTSVAIFFDNNGKILSHGQSGGQNGGADLDQITLKRILRSE